MAAPRITIPHDELAALCRRWRVRRLSLFGSVLRDDFGPESDVDVLLEFEPDGVPTLFTFEDLRRELSQLFGGRRVDMVTPGALHPRLRDAILDAAVPTWIRTRCCKTPCAGSSKSSARRLPMWKRRPPMWKRQHGASILPCPGSNRVPLKLVK